MNSKFERAYDLHGHMHHTALSLPHTLEKVMKGMPAEEREKLVPVLMEAYANRTWMAEFSVWWHKHFREEEVAMLNRPGWGDDV